MRIPFSGTLALATLLLSGCHDAAGPGAGRSRVWIGQSHLTLVVGEIGALTAFLQSVPDGPVVELSVASWTSSQDGVLTVDSAGAVLAVTEGHAVVSVRHGSARDSADIRIVAARPTPERRWISVSVGAETTCAVDVAGAAYCWGGDYFGTDGDGVHRQWTSSHAPVKVTGGLTFESVSVGLVHACALSISGQPFCWGSGASLGHGGGILIEPVGVEFDGAFESLSSGSNHVCGVSRDGSVHCWGLGAYGELGDGVLGISSRSRPAAVLGEGHYATVQSGDGVTCALSRDARVECWGAGNKTGTVAQADVATPTVIAADEEFVRLSGRDHMCAQTVSGGSYCWGPNRWGQITLPAEWVAQPAALGDGPGRISAGSVNTCGTDEVGTTSCWGWDREGALGSGNVATDVCGGVDAVPCRRTPTPVAAGIRFATLSLGAASSCGISTAGELYCWGSNGFGQLGDGSLKRFSASPVRVLDPR